MARLIAAAGPFRLEPRTERGPFHALASAIAHQQLHGVAARRILERFVALFTGVDFPAPHQVLAVSDAQLRAVGFSFAKVAALKDLAAKTIAAVVPAAEELDELSDAELIERISSVRGIGRWSVEMLLIFYLRRPDVLPVDDLGVRTGFRLAYGLKALPTPRALAQFGERWKPYRSMAAWYLWRAVELARTKRLPPSGRPPRIAQVSLRKRVRAKRGAKPLARLSSAASSRKARARSARK